MSLNVRDLLSATAYDNNGDKLGSVNEVFVDDASGQPTFVDVNHGLFGMGNSLVPLRGHSTDGDALTLGFAKDRIKDAPDFDSDKPLTPQQQTEIYQHYGISDAADVEGYTGGERPNANEARTDNDSERTDDGAGIAGAGAGAASTDERPTTDFSDNIDNRDNVESRDTVTTDADSTRSATTEGTHADTTAPGAAAANTGSASDSISDDNASMIRSEEHLNVDTERVQTGEARLRKYVVTDTETVEVPVTREEVKVERTPIDPDDASAQSVSGGLNSDISEDEASVTLHEERVVVNKETVPVEKVNLSTEQVSDTERVTEEVRKEQIETDGVDGLDSQK